jgi:hypothetical protein
MSLTYLTDFIAKTLLTEFCQFCHQFQPTMKITPLPIHFKTPGRSYSQIGRKGNVALYSVYSDYFSLPDFALPYLLIGFELVTIKTNRAGVERYPRDEEFGHCAFAISRASKRFGRTRVGMRGVGRHRFSIQKPKTFPNRSATSEESCDIATLAPSEHRDGPQADQTSAKVSESVTRLSPRRVTLRETMIANHETPLLYCKEGGRGFAARRVGVAATG